MERTEIEHARSLESGTRSADRQACRNDWRCAGGASHGSARGILAV